MGVQINGSEGNVIATKGTYSGNVTIGGTLTYEDVTNIDSVGIITARSGIEIGASPGVGASISVDGNAIFSGITTATTLQATTGDITTLRAPTGIVTSLEATTGDITTLRAPTGIVTTFVTNTAKVGAAVTITESGIEASGIGITVANINGTQIGGRRNRVQNGDMRITQRYGTNAHTPSNNSRNYVMDRWAYWSSLTSKASIQQVEDGPAGFRFSAKITSLAATSATSGDWFGFLTTIEAQDLYDLEQGTANAKDFTLSFYVKSSVTGTWAAAIRTKASSPDRSYPFNYTISSANTWERKTITIPGSTDGTWLTGTSEGICLWFDLGSGSTYHETANQWYSGNATGPSASPFIAVNAATFYITGVQLEEGLQATTFEHHSFTEEYSLCQRYYQTYTGVANRVYAVNVYRSYYALPVQMRSSPTFTKSYSVNTNLATDNTTADTKMFKWDIQFTGASSGYIDILGGTFTLDSEF